MSPIYTIGHSNRTLEDFLKMLQAHDLEQVLDVRTAPGSRKYPHFMRESLAKALPENSISYVHLPDLGGFRKPRADSENAGWRNASFRGYADYMQTPEFEEALEHLLDLVRERQSGLLCSEAVPWRCHRSLIADALTVRGIPVEHIMSATKRNPHQLTPFAVVDGKHLTYPPEHSAPQSI